MARIWRELWYNIFMFKPKFTITPEINNRIAEAERIREVVDKSMILPQQELVLRYRAKVDAAHSSTSIEGNTLNKQEVKKVFAGKLIRGNARMITEILNHKKAFSWIEKHLTEIDDIKYKDILSLHSLLMKDLLPKEKIGHFRKGSIYVVDVEKNRDIVRYTGPEASQVSDLIKELLIWLKNEGEKLHPILTAGLLHLEFVSIHAFADGNGRLARLLTMLYLWIKKYDYKKVLVLDTFYWQNRLEYYTALDRGKTYQMRKNTDLTPWIEFFTKGFLETAYDLEKEITAVSVSGKVENIIRLSNDELTIIDFAKQMGKIDIQDMLDILHLPQRTIQRRLKRLVDEKLLKKCGEGKGVFYQL